MQNQEIEDKDENIIKPKYLITFSEELIPNSNLRQLFLDIKNAKYLINGSHEVYEYLHEFDNYIYIFEGFYQDGYFVLVYDIIDKRTKNKVESKDVYVIPIEWKLTKNSENVMRWSLDVNTEIYMKIYKLNIRKRLYEIPFLRNFIENTDHEEIYIKIKRNDVEFTHDVLSQKLMKLYEKINKFSFFK